MNNNKFTVSIIGLGLMGGSLAYALRGFRGCVIIGYDINPETSGQALSAGAIDIIARDTAEACSFGDLVVFCAPPEAVLMGLGQNLSCFKKGAVITEICGVKSEICRFMALNADKLSGNAEYAGLHPMAGKEVGGFTNADPAIFRGAGFIIVHDGEFYENAIAESRGESRLPPSKSAAVNLLTEISRYAGAGQICVNTAAEHDRIIAYTSDLMHIAAAALCRDYPAGMMRGHTAGAFRDCTRIANIDADLWTELLTANAAHILPHLDAYIRSLSEFRTSLAENDNETLRKILAAACKNKKEMLSL